MDSFESVIASLLERDGFWVRSSVKIELSKAEKRFIGRASSPRWELDLVAFKGKTNELWIIECKSFLDSRGVDLRAFQKGTDFSKRYKLFNEKKLFRVVKNRLLKQLSEKGFIKSKPKVRLVLAAGKIVEKDQDAIEVLFEKRGWQLWDEKEW